MTRECACASIDVDRASELLVVGGSSNPSDAPWGELRRCPRCPTYFRYTRDHDNEIGYVEDPPTLDRLDADGALRLAKEALVAARRLEAHFAAGTTEFAVRAAEAYAAEIQRLEAAVAELGGRSDQSPGRT